MPKLDGFEICQSIKKNPTTSSIPIIFLTAKNSTEDEYKGLLVGGDDYVVKPVAVKNLLLRIQNTLNKKSKENTYDYSKNS